MNRAWALLFLISAASRAELPKEIPLPKPACERRPWTGPYELEAMQMQFGQIPRADLIQIAWTESLGDPLQSVAGPVLYYLHTTETHEPLKKYYQELANGVGAGKFTMLGLIVRYPVRKGNAKLTRSLKDLCKTYDGARQTRSVASVAFYEKELGHEGKKRR